LLVDGERARGGALGLLASHRHGRGFEPLLNRAARSAEEQEREGDANPGEDGDGEEGRLEALGQGDERVWMWYSKLVKTRG
jgi:hypothetical protein